MRTPSLRRRVMVAALAVFATLVLALETFIAVSLRANLEETLRDVLAARVEVTLELVDTEDATDLPGRLTALGIPAVITDADGGVAVTSPTTPPYGPGPPGRAPALDGPHISEVLALPDGGEVEVVASRAGVDATMRRVLLLMGIGTLLALALGFLLLRRVTATAMAPLGEMVQAARRTTSGQSGQRLRPDDEHTELGHLAVAYDEMLDALEGALERAQEAEESTRRFVVDAAHQLRTPLAGVRASVESLLHTDDPRDRDRLMTNLIRETARGSRVLNDLLQMARLDSGRPPERTPTDLYALARDEVERTRSLAPDLAVECTCPVAPPPTEVDESGLREVLANLLDNARRHAATRVDVTLEATPEWVRVRVDDDGPGVAPEARNLAFERFATLDGQGGSGLGLPIARAIVVAHGGELTCDQRGFELHLPITTGAEATGGDGAG